MTVMGLRHNPWICLVLICQRCKTHFLLCDLAHGNQEQELWLSHVGSLPWSHQLASCQIFHSPMRAPSQLPPGSHSDRSLRVSFSLRGKYAATQLLSPPFSSAVNGGASLTRGPMLFQRSLVNVTVVPCSCMCTHMCNISDSVSLPRGVAHSI